MKNITWAVVCLAAVMPLAYAEQGGLVNSGGSTAGAYNIINAAVANPPGTLNITATTLTFQSTDGTVAVNATFSSISSVESCSGSMENVCTPV